MTEQPKCELCGEPMPLGEEMFKIHGYSGNCPKPPLPKDSPGWMESSSRLRAWIREYGQYDNQVFITDMNVCLDEIERLQAENNELRAKEGERSADGRLGTKHV